MVVRRRLHQMEKVGRTASRKFRLRQHTTSLLRYSTISQVRSRTERRSGRKQEVGAGGVRRSRSTLRPMRKAVLTVAASAEEVVVLEVGEDPMVDTIGA